MTKNFTTLFFAFFLVLNKTEAQNNALQFDGSDDRVTGTMSALPQGNAARTIEAWIKYTTGNDKAIFNYGTDQNNQVFALHLYNGVYIVGYNNDISTGFAVNDGSWHHLAVTHDGTTTKVYVDGVERGSKTTTYATTGTNFQIGTYLRGTYGYNYNGTIDEVRVWNVARTQAQIQASMNQELSSGTGLIAAFHFNETSGTTAADAVSSNNGTLSNFNFTSSSGWVSGAVLTAEILNFEGKHNPPFGGQGAGGNLLTWQTASENNSSHFDIERSSDGISFEKIGETKAQGKAATYQFADDAPLCRGYYRIKEVDFDKKATLSKVIMISTNVKNKLKIYPSVTTGFLTVETNENTANFHIINLLGQTILRCSSEIGGLDVSALPKGTYFLKVSSEQVKFIKQ